MVGFERKKGCLGSLFFNTAGPKKRKKGNVHTFGARFPGANACEIPVQPGKA